MVETGYMVVAKPSKELRIRTTKHVECFTRERVEEMTMTGAGVRIRTPAGWREFRLTPELTQEALRLLDPPPKVFPQVRKLPQAPRVTPDQMARALVAFEHFGNGLTIAQACAKAGIGKGTYEYLRHASHGPMRAEYLRATKARQALQDVRRVVSERQR